jgi:hypothetical protein
MATAPPEPQAIDAHVCDFAVLEQDLSGAVEHHGGLSARRGGPARTGATGRRQPLRVMECQPIESHRGEARQQAGDEAESH